MRALLDENVMNALNSKPQISEENKIEVKYNYYLKICEVLKNNVQNLNKYKFFETDYDNLPKDLNGIYSKFVTENINDKLINNFPLIDFKFFILFKNFMDDFFKNENFEKIKNKFDISEDSTKEVKKNLSTLQKFYFINFLVFTLVYIDKFKLEEKNFKAEIIKDSQEYYS